MGSSKKAETDLQFQTTTVLVAEDDPITRQLLKRFLEESGHDVLVANDGEQAWSLFKSHQPSLVITDWRMPRLDGLGLCQRIRSQEQTHYTYLLILTSTTDKDAMEHGFAAGADDFMTKPFNRAELAWRIHTGLRVLGLQATLESRINQLDQAHNDLQQATEEMRAGLTAAAKTQQSLLPKIAPEVAQTDCVWIYRPSEHLGGDSLNLFALDQQKLGFFIADVCGHGLPSALLAVMLHRVLTPVHGQASLLNSDDSGCAEDLFDDPGAVLTEVNKRFPINIENGEYFSAVYGILDTRLNELRFAGAGHPNPLIIAQDGSIRKLQTEGFPIGFDESMEYETQSIDMQPGQRLFLYTDGVAEAQNKQSEMFSPERLADYLSQSIGETPERVIEQLMTSVAEWTGEEKQDDDVSMIIIDHCPVAQPALDALSPVEADAVTP